MQYIPLNIRLLKSTVLFMQCFILSLKINVPNVMLSTTQKRGYRLLFYHNI